MEKEQKTVKPTRPETMPMQFGEDHPGAFIRGDRAMYLSFLMNSAEQVIDKNVMANLKMNGWDTLKDALGSCCKGPIDDSNANCQFMKPFEECIIEGEDNE